jgi:hypothetical protein
MDNLFKKIMSFDPGENDTHIDAQGRDFNTGQSRILKDAQKYLDMNSSDTLGGKSRETFETMEQMDQTIQQYQRQVSDMGRAHNQMMRETDQLIKFINNPKYRGQTVTIQEVSKSGEALVTDGKPITGYVNSSSVFLPSATAQKAKKVIKVTFENPELIGRKTVPTKQGDPKLYIAQDASSKTPLFLFTGSKMGDVNGLIGATTGDSLSPNIGKNNLDGASSNLFIKNAVDTDPATIKYTGCVDAPAAGGKWIQASGDSNNWSVDTCKGLADAQGAKQFALGAESWKLNVIHAGSAKADYSGTYLCGEDMSNDRIAYRSITYNGKNMPVRLLLYPDPSQYFDADGNILGYLGASTPLMSPGGPAFGPVKNCWPTFLHPEKLNYYITYVIEDKVWLLVEDVSCAEVAPGDTSIDEPRFFSSACIKPGLAKRGTGCNVWAGKWTDGCAGGAGNVINVMKAPSSGAPGIGHVAAGAGGASASQWGSGKSAGSPLVFGEDCVTVYQLGSEPFPTSASKSVANGPGWLVSTVQSIAAKGDGTAPAAGSLPYYLKGTLTGTAPNVSIKWENGCTWTADNSDGNAFVNFEAATSKVIAEKKARNPLGKWGGQESITVLLSMSCWYAKDGAPALSSDNDIVIAGQFDGTNTILFDIPNGSNGLYIGVDGILYAGPPPLESGILLGADSAVKDNSYVKFTESVVDNGDTYTGSNMLQYYEKIGNKQIQKRCRYEPTDQPDGYPSYKGGDWRLNESMINNFLDEDASNTELYNIATNPNVTDSCHGWTCDDSEGTKCGAGAPGSLGVNYYCMGGAWVTDPPPAEWKSLVPNAIHCPDSTYDEGVVNQSIMWATDDAVIAQVAGTYKLSDPGNPGSGGVYTVGSQIENACSKETIPISGTYKCGADVKTSSANNRVGSTIKMTCPGEKPCYVHLLLSDEGELMMVSGEYSGTSPSDSDVLWKTKKIGVKAGVATPNPSWRTDPAVWKIGGNPVPYIPGNSTLPKGGFLLSANGVYRLAYGAPLKQDRVAQGGGTSNNWSADFLTRFQILDDVPSSKNLLTSSAGGGSMAGGGETTCDSCAVIEYTVKSCKPLQTLKFDQSTGKYVIPADKEKHKYSLSGAEVALYENPNANNTGLYKTFYVDEYNVPFVLNPDAISYDNSDDYIYFGNFSLGVVDPSKAALKVTVGKSPSDTEKMALQQIRNDGTVGDSVKAFNLDIATGEVWLFTDLKPSMELHPPEVNMRPGLRLYMKKPSRVLSSVGEDCSAMVLPAGSKDIIGQAGGPWNDSTLSAQTNVPKKCNLPRNLDGIQGEFYKQYETGAMQAGKQIANAIPGLEQTRDTLAKGLSNSREEIDNTMATYEKLYKNVVNMMGGGTMDGQLENSQIKLVEDNYQYILWSVLAIALVMFAMSLHRK